MRSKDGTRKLFLTRKPFLVWLVVPAILCASGLAQNIQARTGQPTKNVLIISEVGASNPAPAIIVRDLVTALTTNQGLRVDLYTESLDSPPFNDESSELKVRQQLSAKYQKRGIDLIVALGPTPIVFMSHFAENFLPGVPVVFCGSSQEQTGYAKLSSRFTGSWLQLAPEKTVDAVLGLLPGTKEVIIVSGSSVFDKTNEAAIRTNLKAYPRNIEFKYWTDLTMPVLLDRLRQTPEDAVVLYVSLFADAAGNRFVNAITSLPLVTDASAVPVFGMSESYLGRGIVGGYVLNYTEQGKITAENALDILHGNNPSTIPIRFVPGVYMFDARQIHRWRLSEQHLPTGSTLLYEDGSVWQHIKWTVMASAFLLFSLGSLTAYLLYSRNQLKRAQGEQARLSGMLINAHEEERKRIASELHDDFSQRLALLSVGIESAADLVRNSPDQASEQLHKALDAARDLSTDLHTLSHRLHSSPLERLGLIPGVEALCNEISAQQGMRVDFSYAGECQSAPPAVALCFFRVVQEGLRNVKKHSGASSAHVGLELRDAQLHLSISDQGAGFDLKELTQKEGVGIFSMEERARYIGARLEIHSEPQKGTRIDLWKQLDQNHNRPEEVLATSELVRTRTA